MTKFLTASCSSAEKCPELIFDPLTMTTTSTDGTPYTGRCVNYQNEIKRSVQQYINGKDYGKWVFYFPNGKIETKGKFNELGLRVGTWKYFHENGEIKQIAKYNKDGNRNGTWKYFHENGEIKQIAKYNKDGNRNGTWVEYNEDGELINETSY